MLLSAHIYIRYTSCATSDHLVQTFCTVKLCSVRVSIKLLLRYAFLENIFVEGKARNKHRPVIERASSYSRPTTDFSCSLLYIAFGVRCTDIQILSVGLGVSILRDVPSGHMVPKITSYLRRCLGWFFCFGFNGPLRQYFSL